MDKLKQKRHRVDVGGHTDVAVDSQEACAFSLCALTDAELLIEYADNRKIEAMQIFVQRHEKKVMAVCRNVTSDANDADDSFQATFLAALKHAKKLRNIDSHGGWLCRVAYNASLKIRRMKRREFSTSREGSLDQKKPDPVPETWRIIEKREEADALLLELFRLPKQYQDCLVLFYFDGLSRADTAKRIGKSVPAVKALLERGRRLLKSRLIKRGVSAAVAMSVIQWSAHTSAACESTVLSSTLDHCESFAQSTRENIPELIQGLSNVGSRVWTTSQITLASLAVTTCLLVAAAIGISKLEVYGDGDGEVVLKVESSEAPRNSIALRIENNIATNPEGKQDVAQIESDLNQKIAKNEARLAQLREWESQKIEHIQTANSEKETSELLEILVEIQTEAANIDSVLEQAKEQLSQVKVSLGE